VYILSFTRQYTNVRLVDLKRKVLNLKLADLKYKSSGIQPFKPSAPHYIHEYGSMTKTLLILLTLTAFLGSSLYAQSREDVIYLNNGSILHGKVIETVSGQHTTIEIVGRNLVVVPDSLLKMILMDQVIPSKDRENKSSAVEMAASVSFFGGTKNSAGCSFITSYRFPSGISVGAGIGNEWFDHQQIPFIADYRYSFLKGSWSPYVYAQTGYAIPLSKKSGKDT